MKSKRIKIALLSAALVAIIVGGIWLLSISGKPSNHSPDLPPDQVNSELAGDLSDERLQFELVSENQQSLTDYMSYLGNIYLYQGEPAQLRYAVSDEDMFEVISFSDSKVIQNYPMNFFEAGNFFSSVYLDGNGQLWILWYDDETNANYLGKAEKAQTTEDLIPLGENPFQYTCERFSVFQQYTVLFGIGDNGSYSLILYDTQSDTTVQWNDISDFWMDDQAGHLYYIENGALIKYELATGSVLWRQPSPANSSYRKLWYHPELGLFCLCSQEGSILCCDTETGITSYELFNMSQDSDLAYQDMANASFAVDSEGHVWFMLESTNHTNPNSISYDITIWEFAPFFPDSDINQAVSLTITAPYPLESIDASIRMYQRDHPEVSIEWDCQYASRDEFLDHTSQYTDQISLRTMTGDVGDIQMISGTGMDLDAVLDTDVMTDLSEYLESDPNLSQLEPALLAPLYDNQNHIRALPLGIRPVYMICNQNLVEQLNLTLDPASAKWSDILNLASQWQHSNRSESIFAMDSTVGVDQLLSHILLANLDQMVSSDNKVNFDQPWFRSLLEQLAELQNSPQLVHTAANGQWWNDNYMDNCLFTFVSGAYYEDNFTRLAWMQEDGSCYRIVPIPLGENSDYRQSYGFCWGIPASSEHKDEAWDFLSFLLSKDGFSSDRYDVSTFSLNNISDYERFEAAQANHPEILEEHYDQFQLIRTSPISRYTEPAGLPDAVLSYLQEYLDGTLSLDEALQQAEASWERKLLE